MLNSRIEYYARKNLRMLETFYYTNQPWDVVQMNKNLPEVVQTAPLKPDTWLIGWYADPPRYILITLTHVYYYQDSWQSLELRKIKKQHVMEQEKHAATNLVLSTADSSITLHIPRHKGNLREMYTWMTFFKQNFNSHLPPHQFHKEPMNQ